MDYILAASSAPGLPRAYPEEHHIPVTSPGVVIGAHCGPGLPADLYLCGGGRPE